MEPLRRAMVSEERRPAPTTRVARLTRTAAPDPVWRQKSTGALGRFGDVPGDDGGATRPGERATTEAEVGVVRG